MNGIVPRRELNWILAISLVASIAVVYSNFFLISRELARTKDLIQRSQLQIRAASEKYQSASKVGDAEIQQRMFTLAEKTAHETQNFVNEILEHHEARLKFNCYFVCSLSFFSLLLLVVPKNRTPK